MNRCSKSRIEYLFFIDFLCLCWLNSVTIVRIWMILLLQIITVNKILTFPLIKVDIIIVVTGYI